MATYGDKTWRPAVAPALRWAQEVRNLEAEPEKSKRCLPFNLMCRVWKQARKKVPKTWGGSRGAVDAVHLSLRRFGWSWTSPVHFTDDRGVTIPLKDTNPKLLAKSFQESIQRFWERKFAKSLGVDGWSGVRVCADPVKTMLNSTWATKNPKAARAAVKAFCGATWTIELCAAGMMSMTQGARCVRSAQTRSTTDYLSAPSSATSGGSINGPLNT